MALLLALLFLLTVPAPGAPPAADTTDTPEALRRAIWQYAGPFTTDAEALHWKTDWADLNDDGEDDALVYLSGPDWCGSGGCTLLLFEAITGPDVAELGPYRPAAEIDLVTGPILVSAHVSNAWCDLVIAGSDGAPRALQFDGESYPTSPDGGEAVAVMPDGQILFAEAR